tara:strand:+ start:522 stop:1142 length:621 start_codon:yes stop_codon:yes gene_type:complete
MAETTWMFGTTSDLSKEIIKNLDNPICFGRHNVDYSDPDKFIKEHVVDNTPVNICVNVFIDTTYGVIETLEEFKEVHNRMAPTIFFFYKLLTMTASLKKPVKVCYITSTFPNSTIVENKKNTRYPIPRYENTFIYGSARGTQQFSYLSRHSEFCKTVGVSPSGLSNENITEYGKTIAELLYKDNDTQWELVYDLGMNCWFDFGINR